MHFDENMETYVEKSGYKVELLICCFVLIISILLDQLYGHIIFNFSSQITILLQEYDMKDVAMFTSYFMFFLLFIYPLICYVIRNHIETSLIMLMQTATLIYFESLFKMIYTDSRPIFANEDIKELHCICDYGKPSGHCMISVALPLLIISDLNSRFRISKNLKVLIIFLYLISVGIVSFSRLYLGEHSINQVSMTR
jgi:membrane-associated phospholipid phosphatase